MIRIMTVNTKNWGELQVFAAIDEAGNHRLVPLGATSLEPWRKDKGLIPPWLTPDDVVGDLEWGHAWLELTEG